MTRDIATPARTRSLMRENGLHVKKSLGQNFLVDRHIVEQMVQAADLDVDAGALEIGPGLGALTEALAKAAGKVVAVEIDARLIPLLKVSLVSYPHVEIVQGDILTVDLKSLSRRFDSCSRWSILGNLPYYITSPIMMRILESSLQFDTMIVMMQKEVADRLTASPGGKDYGSLTVAAQYYAAVSTICHVPRQAFIPPPTVNSTVVRLKRREAPPVVVTDEKWFFRVVRAAFAHRRKTLLNNLHSELFPGVSKEKLAEHIEKLSIDPKRRGETFSLREFAQLSNSLLIYKN